ncbi:Cytochrome c oxidase subunit 6A1, mitochondrial [Rhizophlyctis rosea]|nr:Cytochrome c oxidase subunit 6A1, mitochondrial [Rhizophlyctis rosea]
MSARLGLAPFRRSAQVTPRRNAHYTVKQIDHFPPYEKIMTKEELEAMHHAEGSVSMWWKINLFLVVPTLAFVTWWAGGRELEHIHHQRTHKENSDYIAWPHSRKRKNPFPWGDGDHSLFHNPWVNRGPEDEWPGDAH